MILADDIGELLRAQAIGEWAGGGTIVRGGGGIETAEQIGHGGKIGARRAGLNAGGRLS